MPRKELTTPFCERFEVKKFAFEEHHPSAINFTRFIEAKSKNQFMVVEQEFVDEMFAALNRQALLAREINEEMYKKWWDVKSRYR